MAGDDLSDRVGGDLSDAELQGLREADELLRNAEPLPEVPERLASSVRAIPLTEEQVGGRPNRRGRLSQRRPAVLAAAAVLAGVAFAIGWVARGGGDARVTPTDIVTLEATRHGSNDAAMVIDVNRLDEGGNWVLLADIEGLPPTGPDQHYELWLTRNNRVVASCGRFLVDENGQAKDIWFNAPYKFAEFDDWVVTREGPGKQRSRVLLRAPVTTRAS